MSLSTEQLYQFLFACSGNWRNSIYISSQEEIAAASYLLAAGRDGQPVVMPVEQLQQLTGEQVDSAECCGQLTEECFKAFYAQYLIWRLPSADIDPLLALTQDDFPTPI